MSTKTTTSSSNRSCKTIIHESREENLQAAKRAIRTYRYARIHRRLDPQKDIIDVIIGSEIIERHIYSPIFIKNRIFAK